MVKEIKIGAIVEVVANYGPASSDDTIGTISKVTNLIVSEGRVFVYLDKFAKGKTYKGVVLESAMTFNLRELEAIDFTEFFVARHKASEMRLQAKKIKEEIEQS